MAFAHHHGGASGEEGAGRVSAIGIMAPRRGPQEAAYLQGKMLGCP
jgi:hypothetical protein